MGQRLTVDKIGAWSNVGLTVTMGLSNLTIGGQQYRTLAPLSTTINSPVALTLYFIYAVISSGSVILVTSTNVNSIGPVGYTSWKLVGAAYTNGLVVPTFGSFVNLEGIPQTQFMESAQTGSFTTNTTYASRVKRNGDEISIHVTINFSGAPNAVTCTLNNPGSLVTDVAKLSSAQPAFSIIKGSAGSAFDSGVNGYKTYIIYDSSTSVRGAYQSNASGTGSGVSNTLPFALGAADFHSFTYDLPIVGWSQIQLKDL